MTDEMTVLEEEALDAGRAFQFAAGLWIFCADLPEGGVNVIEGYEE